MGRREGVQRGYVPMIVGRGKESERILVHTKLFNHPCLVVLLEMAAQEFGYKQQGILRIPCAVEHFRSAVRTASKIAASGVKWHIPRLPEGFSVRMPTSAEMLAMRADTEASWLVHGHYFSSGWVLPMPPIIAEFLIQFGLAPCQLQPNGYKQLFAAIEMFRGRGIELTVADLRALLSPMKTSAPNTVALRSFATPPLVHGLPNSEKGGRNKPVILVGDVWNAGGGVVPPPAALGNAGVVPQGR